MLTLPPACTRRTSSKKFHKLINRDSKLFGTYTPSTHKMKFVIFYELVYEADESNFR